MSRTTASMSSARHRSQGRRVALSASRPQAAGQSPCRLTPEIPTPPRASNAVARWPPAKPVMPVTKIRIISPWLRTLEGGGVMDQFEVGLDHEADQFGEVHLRFPAQDAPGLTEIPHEEVHLRRPGEGRILDDILLPVQVDAAERCFHQFADRMGLAGGD